MKKVKHNLKSNLKGFNGLVLLVVLAITLSSCSSMQKSIREPNARVEFVKDDFEFSEQVSAEATSVKILGIDWARLFSRKGANVGTTPIDMSLPIIGNPIMDETANYSLHRLMEENPGYDVIFYPQYEKKVSKPILGISLLVKKTTVKTTARLGRIKK